MAERSERLTVAILAASAPSLTQAGHADRI